jgi:hypothetical protein
MKCLDECGFHERPDNIPRLQRHLEECRATGASSRLSTEPTIIWKDGEFTVVAEATKKDNVFDIPIPKREAVELDESKIKTAADVARALISSPNITRGSISDSTTDTTKKVVKKRSSEVIAEGFEEAV